MKNEIHSVYSVHSVVKNLNHGLHRMHGYGAAAPMDDLMEELNREMTA